MKSDRLFFLAFVIYLPLSIALIFWLQAVSILYLPDAWQYRLFYGQDGNRALLWLLVILLPAFLFLVFKTRQKVLAVRFAGAVGFYCLLGSLVSAYDILVLPGAVFIIASIIINRLAGKSASR